MFSLVTEEFARKIRQDSEERVRSTCDYPATDPLCRCFSLSLSVCSRLLQAIIQSSNNGRVIVIYTCIAAVLVTALLAWLRILTHSQRKPFTRL